jgi:putative tricarboxylic transport membrane protein
MDLLGSMALGFQASLQPINLLYCFIGVTLGTLVGVLPGIGPIGTMGILLPVTFQAPALASVIMLAGIYYGAMYGGSTTSILLNIPGETASVVTTFDGHQMAIQGRAGPALGISAFASFIAGTLAVVGLVSIAGPLASVALKFGPPEYFSLMIMGLVILVYITQKSLTKAIIMACIGLMISYVGTDVVTGTRRFTFGMDDLLDGVGIVPMVIGLFGITEVLVNLESKIRVRISSAEIRGVLPSIRDWADSISAILRGGLIGFFLGTLPGGGAVIASFVSYAIERRGSKHPERFGKGAIEGVAGPEAANNAASSSCFIPLLTLGIPPNATMAMLFAGLLIHNITPGPMLISDHPQVFWGLVTSMYIGNVMLLVLNLPLIRVWVTVTRVPFRLLFPVILLICAVGAYSSNNSVSSLWIMFISGAAGYILKKSDFEPAPLVLAYVLGSRIDQCLRQSLMISNGSFTIFATRPISAVCLGIAAFLLITICTKYAKEKRIKIVQEAEKEL